MTKEKVIPQIRFSGFTDTWEQRKLSAIADKVTEKNVGLQYIETFTNSAEFGIISQRDFFDHDIAKMSSLGGYYIVRSEDFVYNPRISTSAPVGPINRNKLGRIGVMSPLYTVFRPHDIDTTYLEYFFKSKYWHSFMNFNGDSGARSDRFSIKDSVFFEMPIPIPHIDEQKKIGEYLAYLDRLITLHQRKYDKLTKVKKAMLEKMFPENGSPYPEIRFKGFTDAWKQRKFREQYQKITEKNDLSFGADKIISVANMYFKSDVKQSDDDYMRSYNIMRLGDIAFEGNKSKHFAHGRFVENTIGDGIVSHVFDVFRPIADYDLLFWKYLINYEGVMGRIMTRCTKASTMMTNLVADDFLAESILVPSIQEQQKIGAFLDKLDSLITLHQRKLEKLKNIKKACLEKMFV